jgi:hypothetical protein
LFVFSKKDLGFSVSQKKIYFALASETPTPLPPIL